VSEKVVEIDTKKKPVDSTCMFCGADHPHMHCPRVKALELDEDGTVAFVEFFEPKTPAL